MATASLADQRKAIGESISSAFDSGKGAAKSRRAIGQRIEAERRGESVVEDLNRLVQPTRQRRSLRPVQSVGAVPVTRGSGTYTPPDVPNGGGIASPLTETDVTLRTYWANGYVSSDGLFTLPAPRQIRMTDANGAEVVFDYADPVPLP